MPESTLADAIQGFLSDPDAGSKISELMQGLSLPSGDTNTLPDKPGNLFGDVGRIMQLKSMFESATGDDPRTTLLLALKPYLSEERNKTLDTLLKLMRIYRVFIKAKEADLLKELF